MPDHDAYGTLEAHGATFDASGNPMTSPDQAPELMPCRSLNTISAVLLLLSGATIGAAVMSISGAKEAPTNGTASYFYYSDIKGEMSIGIKSDGTADIGRKYDRTTEAMKLLDAAREMQRDGVVPPCHETAYSSPYWSAPDRGMAQVFPGPANPPPTRFEWRF